MWSELFFSALLVFGFRQVIALPVSLFLSVWVCVCVWGCVRLCFYSRSWATRSNMGKKNMLQLEFTITFSTLPDMDVVRKTVVWSHTCSETRGMCVTQFSCVPHCRANHHRSPLCLFSSRQLLCCNVNRWEGPVTRSELLRGAALNSCSSAPPGMTSSFLIFKCGLSFPWSSLSLIVSLWVWAINIEFATNSVSIFSLVWV